jgi:hypothetical protein
MRLNRPAGSACSKAVVDYFPDIDQWQPFGSTWGAVACGHSVAIAHAA